jgi:hypothetical protein
MCIASHQRVRVGVIFVNLTHMRSFLPSTNLLSIYVYIQPGSIIPAQIQYIIFFGTGLTSLRKDEQS